MQLAQETRAVARAGVLETARATIKATPKIFNFFADSTYANKPVAICRELVANAQDGHTAAGKSHIPVEVWLPTVLDPTFRVRDQGIGMSHEFMMTRFMAYTDGSTKDSDNSQIGGFGIGSKSPFAYVDQFTIVSTHDGVRSVYSVFKDEDGIPSIALLDQASTDLHNGVEVSFPVQEDDFLTFENAAFESLKYFDPLPIIKNSIAGAFKLPDYVSRGKGWAMRLQSGPLAVIMGGIRYPVATANLTHKFDYDSPARKLLEYGLDLILPIGTCSVALSREALSYDDKTIVALKDACDLVIEEVAASFSTMFDHFDTLWEARSALSAETADQYSARGKFLLEHAQYRGQPFDVKVMPAHLGTTQGWDGKPVKIFGFQTWTIDSLAQRLGRRSSNRPPCPAAKWDDVAATRGFDPSNVEALIIDDLPQEAKYRSIRRIKDFVDESDNGKSIIVVRPNEARNLTVEQIVTAFENPPADIVVLTSTLPEPEKAVRTPTNKLRPRVRMFTYEGRSNGQYNSYTEVGNITPGKYGRRGVDEIPYINQPLEGIFVAMEKFDLPYGLYDKMRVGLVAWSELYFVNRNDAKKLDKSRWRNFFDVFEDRRKAAVAEYPELPQRLAVSNSSQFQDLFNYFRSHAHQLSLTPAQQKSPFGRILNLYLTYVEPLTHEQLKLAKFVEAKLPGRVKPDELLNAFKTKQWKAARLLELTTNGSDIPLILENLS